MICIVVRTLLYMTLGVGAVISVAGALIAILCLLEKAFGSEVANTVALAPVVLFAVAISYSIAKEHCTRKAD